MGYILNLSVFAGFTCGSFCNNGAKAKAEIIIDKKDYALLTLHRPNSVDNREIFENILEALQEVSRDIVIIFPAHPRAQKQIKFFGYEKYFNFKDLDSINSINPTNSIILLEPLSYSGI